MAERIVELSVQVAPEHLLHGLTLVRAGGDRAAKVAPASATSSDSTTAVPPIDGGASTPISGNSSARWRLLPARRSSTDIRRPSGVGIRLISSAPNASR